MDEPFGALDPITRLRLQTELRRLHREVGKTVIFVTHDVDEAIQMGDRIAILREGGVLAQYDTPDAILAHPADEFVAQFIGEDRALRRLALRTLARRAAATARRQTEPRCPRLTRHHRPERRLARCSRRTATRSSSSTATRVLGVFQARATREPCCERGRRPVIPNFGQGSACVTRRPHVLLGLGAGALGRHAAARRSSSTSS